LAITGDETQYSRKPKEKQEIEVS